MTVDDNIIISGFMGTGKTSVGREVARRLHRPFVDMDAEIESRAGKSIPRIFADDGEVVFRQMESLLCDELSKTQGKVIATGGGTLIEATNRQRMLDSGIVICLACTPGRILERLIDKRQERPLLDVADREKEIKRLLAARHTAYEAIRWHIDTSQLTISEVAERVVALVHSITLPVTHPNGSYDIHIGSGLLDQVGVLLRAAEVPLGSRVALVSNPIVAPLYARDVAEALHLTGYAPFPCTVPDGEKHKTLTTVDALYEQFLAHGLDRGDTVLSIGGGVTGDIAGFAAATFLRGVRFVQLPTTLLAMVDASVGGKTGVDLPQGKNLVGAFKQPILVIIDPTVLATLPIEEIRSGLAEVIKHGIIADPDLFAALEDGEASVSRWWDGEGHAWIARALRVKIDIVEEDPFEHGRRAVLNLGHTAGHAIERLSGFSLRHGEAVSIGLLVAAGIAVKMHRAPPELAERIEATLTAWGLPTRCPAFDPSAIWDSMAHDKKRRGRALRWILPLEIGSVDIFDDVPRGSVENALRTLGAKG